MSQLRHITWEGLVKAPVEWFPSSVCSLTRDSWLCHPGSQTGGGRADGPSWQCLHVKPASRSERPDWSWFHRKKKKTKKNILKKKSKPQTEKSSPHSKASKISNPFAFMQTPFPLKEVHCHCYHHQVISDNVALQGMAASLKDWTHWPIKKFLLTEGNQQLPCLYFFYQVSGLQPDRYQAEMFVKWRTIDFRSC